MKNAARITGILLMSIFALAGCHELGHVDGPGDYSGTDNLIGEVRRIDARNREIELPTDAGHRAARGE